MILVTGATGTVGGHVVEALTAAGSPVRALVRSPEEADVLKGYDAEVAIGDFTRPQTLGPALDGITKIFLVAPASREQPALEKALIDAAVAAGGQPHVVKLAVIGLGPDGPALGRNHHDVVEHLKASGLPHRAGAELVHAEPADERGLHPAGCDLPAGRRRRGQPRRRARQSPRSPPTC